MKSPLKRKSAICAMMALMLAQFACNFGRPPSSVAATQLPAVAPQATAAGPSTAAGCQNDYFPVKSGATWTSNGTMSTGSFTRVATITEASTTNFQAQTVLTDGAGKQIATIESWNCTNEGLVQLGGPIAASIQSVFGGESTRTLSTTGVTIPTHINPGDSWSQVTELEFTIPNLSITGTFAYNFQALGLEQITVPAGTFNAMKVQVSAKSESIKSGLPITITADGFYWFAPGVGRVKGSEKISANGNLVTDVEGELQSFHIP